MCRPLRKRHSGGFTLIEVLIVVMVLGVLMSIAVPAFMKARETSSRKTCLANLKQIENAKLQFSMEEKIGNGDSIDWDDLVPRYLLSKPECPAGGIYTPGTASASPECTIGAHELP